jgi:hypothetical protein
MLIPGGSSDPDGEVRLWKERIAECSRLRSAYQDQQAAGLMTLKELASKLATVQETQRVAEAELATLRSREERGRELEADRDALVASYAEMVPEALDGSRAKSAAESTRCCGWRSRPTRKATRSAGRFVVMGRRADVVSIVQSQPNCVSTRY